MYLIRDILLIAILLVAGSAAFVWFGGVQIGADVPHSPLVYNLLDRARQRSIEVHAKDIAVPPLDDAQMIAEGAEHYDAMCTGCHLAPGMDDTEMRRGLYPQPPKLAEARGLPPAQAFWAIKHGIKLTAMPAWGATHDNEAIWNIVAFLQKLPDLTPEQYKAVVATAAHDHAGHEHDHAQEHEHGTGDAENAAGHDGAAEPGRPAGEHPHDAEAHDHDAGAHASDSGAAGDHAPAKDKDGGGNG